MDACCGSDRYGHRSIAPEIEQRLDAVENSVLQQTILRAELRKQLGGILDLGTAASQGDARVRRSARSLGAGALARKDTGAEALLRHSASCASARTVHERLDELPGCSPARFWKRFPMSRRWPLTDGGTIRAGFHAELDELRDLSLNGRQYIAQIEARERQRTGIQSLKVRFPIMSFGYYLEITRANLHLAPADYERKQTLANAERFTTPELKEYERKVLSAEEKILALERELFADVRQRTAAQAQRIRATASAVAELDVTAALAQVAAENRYQRPRFSEDGEMRIMAGRHPVIERLADQEAGQASSPTIFFLNDSSDLIDIITGPNMGGKSTYLRQAAPMAAILAQMGSFVLAWNRPTCR